MNDWRGWKGDTSEAVEELIKALNFVKREDIVFKIANKLREGRSQILRYIILMATCTMTFDSDPRCIYFLFCYSNDIYYIIVDQSHES